MGFDTIALHKCFGGTQGVYGHMSAATGTQMQVAIYTPPQAADGPVPVLTFLAGLTATWENFTVKAGAQRYAAEHGVMLVVPDTSPRGTNYPGEHDADDFGSGAGFYVDATQEPWSRTYRMYSYIVEDLQALLATRFPAADLSRQGILGHSMGGHGALVCALRNPDLYGSVSALAPIVAPSRVPWGEKAFNGYLGNTLSAWHAYDASRLAGQSEWRTPILIDQGTQDPFLETQLRPQLFVDACSAADIPVTLRMQEGYDHSYYFIATFIADHIRHHLTVLNGG